MHRFRPISLLAWLIAAAGGAQDPRVLTEAEYLSALDEKHPAVRESAQALARAEARVTAARTFAEPCPGRRAGGSRGADRADRHPGFLADPGG